jgi:hypothetical protein
MGSGRKEELDLRLETPRHEDVWRSGSIAPHILNVDAKVDMIDQIHGIEPPVPTAYEAERFSFRNSNPDRRAHRQ